MGSVGGKPPLLLERLLLTREASFQPGQHPVDGFGKIGKLVIACHRQPVRQIFRFNLPRRRRDAPHRTQRTVGQEYPAEARNQQADGDKIKERPGHLGQLGSNMGERSPRLSNADQLAAVPDRQGEDPHFVLAGVYDCVGFFACFRLP